MESLNEQRKAAAVEKLLDVTNKVKELLNELSADTLTSHEASIPLLVTNVVDELNYLQGVASGRHKVDAAERDNAKAALDQYRKITTEYTEKMRALRG